jgi:hypothetical protein
VPFVQSYNKFGVGLGRWHFDATLFATGTLKVSVTLVDVAGNTAVVPQTLTLNNLAAGTAHVEVGGDTNINALEAANALTPINVVVLAGSVINSITVAGTLKPGGVQPLVTKNLITGAWEFDATQFVNGPLTVTVTSSVGAVATVQPTVTLTLANPLTPLDVLVPVGDVINSVTVSGTLKAGGVQPLVTYNPLTGAWEFDATQFVDGPLTVTVNSTPTGGVAANLAPVTITLDTVAPTGAALLTQVGVDAIVSLAEISATTTLVFSGLVAGESVRSGHVTGINNGTGLATSTLLVQDALGNWTFDATQFATGTLKVSVTLVDVAGNTSAVNQTLTLNNLVAGQSHIEVGGDGYINKAEAVLLTPLNVLAPLTDVINTVIISGVPKAGVGALTAVATKNVLTGFWEFDATLFADGALTVTVNSTPAVGVPVNLAPVTITLDTVAPATGASLQTQVGADAVVSLVEASTTTPLTISGVAVGESVQWLQVTNAGSSTAVHSAQGYNNLGVAQGTWTFDSTALATGLFNVYAVVADAAGNTSISKLTMEKVSAVIDSTGVATTVNANDTLYQDISVAGFNDVYTIAASINAVVEAGAGNDTVILSVAPASSTFFLLDGGAGAADTLQLSALFNTLTLTPPVTYPTQIKGFEVFDLATDIGANTVTLTAADLFHQGSNLIDATNGAQTVVINGGVNDTATIGVNAVGGFVISGTANTFDATGAVGVGYSKYTATYTDVAGAHQVELLLQNGMIVA